MRKASGHKFQEIIRGLAFKWQRIIWACWQARQAYDEERYLERLRVTNSKLIAFLPPCPSNQVKSLDKTTQNIYAVRKTPFGLAIHSFNSLIQAVWLSTCYS